ncbi:MAG: DUF6588 family protein [Candidatus Delongbacteria bacterium]
MKMARFVVAGLLSALVLAPARAATSFDDLLESVGVGVQDYAQPLGDAATLLAGGGAYHGARSKGVAGFDLGVKLLLVPVSSGDPAAGTILDQTDVSAVGLPMLVANKGLIKGLQVGARYMSLEFNKDVGQLSLLGASLRFELNELFHVPLLMPRIGVQGDWNQLKIGESVTNTTTGVDLIVSKSFIFLEPYAGISLLKGSTDLEYTYTPASPAPPQKISTSLDSDATRLAVGVNITPFPLLRVNAEYALGDYNTMTVGVLLSLF